MPTPSQIRILTTALSGLVLLVGLSVVLLLSSAFLLPDDKPVNTDWEGTSARSTSMWKTTPLTQQQLHGKILFTNNCAQCHALTDEVVVGPGLFKVTTRTPGKAWLLKWVRNSQTVVAAGDVYAVTLYNRFNKVAMPSFPNLTDADINAILTYVDAGANQEPAVLR